MTPALAPSLEDGRIESLGASRDHAQSTCGVVRAHLSDPLAGKLSLAPCTVKAALRYVAEHHRHLPKLQGGLFAASCVDPAGEVVAVAIAGNPSRVWQGDGKIVITRVAATVAGNACGMLYGSLCRAAAALGYREVWTYTLPEEDGRTLKGAGFKDMGLTDGGDYGRPSRARAPAVRPEPKRRWLRTFSHSRTPLAASLKSREAQ